MNDKLTWQHKLIALYIPFNLIWDFLSIFYGYGQGQSILALTRAGIMLMFFLALLPRLTIKSKLNKCVWFFIIYIVFDPF
jgi:hypothetical protein